MNWIWRVCGRRSVQLAAPVMNWIWWCGHRGLQLATPVMDWIWWRVMRPLRWYWAGVRERMHESTEAKLARQEDNPR